MGNKRVTRGNMRYQEVPWEIKSIQRYQVYQQNYLEWKRKLFTFYFKSVSSSDSDNERLLARWPNKTLETLAKSSNPSTL